MKHKKNNISQDNWIDSHGHISDSRLAHFWRDVVEESIVKGVGRFIQGGVGPEDWYRQLKISDEYPDRVFPVFGLHPYWVSAQSYQECERAFDLLKTLLVDTPNVFTLGELGLDFRSHLLGKGKQHQIEWFVRQLDLSKELGKSCVFHFVRCHGESIALLKSTQLEKEGVVHSFNGDINTAYKYLDLNCSLSIGGAVTWEKNWRLREAVSQIPLEKILLESDCPDQAPRELSEGEAMSYPWAILYVAREIAYLRQMDERDVLRQATLNAENLFSCN